MTEASYRWRLTAEEQTEYAQKLFELLKDVNICDVSFVYEEAHELLRQHSVNRYYEENPVVLTKGNK